MIYVTGDCHGEYQRFSVKNFPQQKDMSRKDFVIVWGDFGIWHKDKTEQWWFKWLSEKNFTILFIDVNHENFDRLYSNEFEVVDFYGGKAHKIRENIFHLMRGYGFQLCGKSIFAFGGASSHDIGDGILDISDYSSERDMLKDYKRKTKSGKMLRINHISWWEQEMPDNSEMALGLKNLEEHKNKVDYIISHCGPSSVVDSFSYGFYEVDVLTQYFEDIKNRVTFSQWFFGHYHDDLKISDKYTLLYKKFNRIC